MVAERGGLDVVGIQDHPYQRRFLDTFALIADLLARTSRLRFFPDVANLAMREPTMLAKAAVSLDVMSGGRFELGIGAGGFWDAVAGMGGPRRTSREAVEALEEAIPLIRGGPRRWAGEARRSRAGTVLPGARVSRRPTAGASGRDLGGRLPAARRCGSSVDSRTAGCRRLATWIRRRSGSPRRQIDDAARAAGRDPGAIRRLYNFGGQITDAASADDPLIGPVDRWVDTLTEWATELGVDTFVFWPSDTETTSIERFAARSCRAFGKRSMHVAGRTTGHLVATDEFQLPSRV